MNLLDVEQVQEKLEIVREVKQEYELVVDPTEIEEEMNMQYSELDKQISERNRWNDCTPEIERQRVQ